jgi:predicted ferric reductase
VFVRFETDGVLSESHPFSISSRPDDDNLSLGIKTLGDYTSMVYLLKPGAICSIEGPFGAFSYTKAQSKRQIWVAGGIGVTPFLSMARDLGAEAKDYAVDLYYSVKNEGELAFALELVQIAKQNSNFKFTPYFSEKNGFLSASFISKNSGGLSGSEVFLCGPSGFMKSLREQFVGLGINNNKIHSEEFSL